MTVPDLSTREGREQMRKIADAAIPEPWRLGEAFDLPASWVAHLDENGWSETTTATSADMSEQTDQEAKDAAFIASARTAFPALLDALEAVELSEEQLTLRDRHLLAAADRAEAAVQRVREVLGGPSVDEEMDAVSAHYASGYEVALQGVRRALDGDA